MAFDLSSIQLPQINLPDFRPRIDEVKNNIQTNLQKIPVFNPDFDPEEFQPLLLGKIEESNLPTYLKTPAKFGVQLMTEDPEDIRKKKEIWNEIRRIHPEIAGDIGKYENAPMNFALIGEDTMNKLPEDLRKSALRYQEQQMMDIGFAVGSVENATEKVGLPLLKGVKAKLGSFFNKNADDLLKEIPEASKHVVSYNTAKDIAETTFEKYLADPENPVFKDETKKLFQQVGELINVGDVHPEDLQAIFTKYNLNPEKFADIYMDTISTAGKQLNELSQLRKKMTAAFPELEEKLADIPLSDTGPWSKLSGVFRNIEQTRRGLLVSQLSTTARNVSSQGGRYTIQFADDVLTGAMEMLTGKRPPKDAFMPAMQDMLAVGRQFSPKRRLMLANTIDHFPIQKIKLFGNPVGDFVLGNKVTSLLNTGNTMQEYFFRRLRMDAQINSHFARGGEALTQDVMENFVDDALDLTFANTPKGGFLKQFYETFSNPFFTAVGNPFPRFWANSLKFLWDFSPGGFTKLLSPAFRKEMMSNNPRKAYSALSKATLGTMMFAGASAIRNSDELAGEKWYEVNTPGGRTWDTRAFAPFSTYLFLAEAMRPDNKLTGADYAQGLLSINRIAGTGLVVVDLIRAQNADTLEKNVKNFAGAYASGFTVPFRTLKDFIAQAVPSEAVYKDTEQAPLLGPAMENVPFLTKDFPTAPRATRAEAFSREDPLLRQLTGLTLKTKTPLEHEIDRLGLDYSSMYPRTGDSTIDRMITRKVGAVLDVVGDSLVTSEEFQKLGDSEKTEVLKTLYSDTKSLSKKITLETDAAQIAAGIYQQMKDMDGEQLGKFVEEIKNKGLLKENIMQFLINYRKADVNPDEVEKFIQENMGGEKTPQLFGVPIP